MPNICFVPHLAEDAIALNLPLTRLSDETPMQVLKSVTTEPTSSPLRWIAPSRKISVLSFPVVVRFLRHLHAPCNGQDT